VTARLAVEADAAAPLTVEVAVTAPDGTALPPVRRTVALDPGMGTVTVPISIPAPQRWWPVGLGAQPLYKVAARIVDGAGPGRPPRARWACAPSN
jgi:beta-mannosidase